jgi:hypothetical protein
LTARGAKAPVAAAGSAPSSSRRVIFRLPQYVEIVWIS